MEERARDEDGLSAMDDKTTCPPVPRAAPAVLAVRMRWRDMVGRPLSV